MLASSGGGWGADTQEVLFPHSRPGNAHTQGTRALEHTPTYEQAYTRTHTPPSGWFWASEKHESVGLHSQRGAPDSLSPMHTYLHTRAHAQVHLRCWRYHLHTSTPKSILEHLRLLFPTHRYIGYYLYSPYPGTEHKQVALRAGTRYHRPRQSPKKGWKRTYECIS